MQIYAACLAAYNNGRLHGAWIDASSDTDEMQNAINAMLRASPCPNVSVTCPECEGNGKPYGFGESVCEVCKGSGNVPSSEEWAIHDYDDFPNMGEHPGLEAIAQYVAMVEDNDHIEPDDMRAIMADFQTVEECAEALRDNFSGIYGSFRDYADECADEMIAAHGAKEDSVLARYFDYEAFARDLAYDMRVIDCPSGVAVFWPH